MCLSCVCLWVIMCELCVGVTVCKCVYELWVNVFVNWV